jgi:hypothetical protein
MRCVLQWSGLRAAHIRNDGPFEVVRVVALDSGEAPAAALTFPATANVAAVGPRLEDAGRRVT